MRNLEECKAEILRLGNEKIKERKKRRKRVLSVCIPLCICIVVLSVITLPSNVWDGDPDGMAPTVLADKLGANVELGTMRVTYTQVEIKGFGNAAEVYNHVNESDKINYIAALIEQYYSKYNNDGYTDKPMLDSDGAEPDAENQQSSYLITFKTATNDKAEYTLSGNILKNNSTNKIVYLTSKERAQLLSELTKEN